MNHKRSRKIVTLLLFMTGILLLFLTACDQGGARETTPHKTLKKVLMPKASGKIVYSAIDGSAQMDASNASRGYVMVKYGGSADRVQVQVTNPKGTRNPYPLNKGKWEAIPLTEGSGLYKVEVLAHISGDRYAVVISQGIEAKIKNKLKPFLIPNQYIDYNPGSKAVKYARKLSDKVETNLDFVAEVYKYVTENVEYDHAFAENIPLNYIPSPDRTMKTGKGICLDYASLTCTMLRSQGIPTKLEVGYSQDVYHAWISIHLKDTGWIEDIIEFQGDKWTLADPTLSADNANSDAAKYMKDKKNYTLKYTY